MTTSASRPRALARPVTGLLVLVPLVAALSACSGSGSGSGSAGTPPSAAGSPTHTTVAKASSSSAFPLDAYLGAGGGTTVISSATQERRYQEAIARCMAAQGFDYVPEPSGSITATQVGGAQVIKLNTPPRFPDLPPDQFAARFGYGISTAPPAGRGGPAVDPNDKIVAAMSVAERVAYQHALYGVDTPLDSQGYLKSTVNGSPQACMDRASRGQPTADQEQAREHRVQRVQTVYKSLLSRIDALNDQEMSDPRVVAATHAWSGCMTAAGFPGYTGIDQPRARMLVRARALMGHDLDPTSVDPARLSRLRRTEIDTAVADNKCRQPWDRTLAGVRRAVEESFVRDNLQELRSYRSAMAAAQQTR